MIKNKILDIKLFFKILKTSFKKLFFGFVFKNSYVTSILVFFFLVFFFLVGKHS